MTVVPHGAHGRPSSEHWICASGMSANSSNVAVPLPDSAAGPDRIDTCGAIPVLAAAITNSADSPLAMSASSEAQIFPVNGLLVSVTSIQVVPSACSSRTAVVA